MVAHFDPNRPFVVNPFAECDDERAMNISSSVNFGQLNSTDPQGASARQDYGVAIATKIKDQIEQEGAAAVKLTESAIAPVIDDAKGRNLSTYA